MKKLILIAIVALIFIFGVLFGKSWAKNSWVTSAVNKGLQQVDPTASTDNLKDCSVNGGIKNTDDGKEVSLNCFNSINQPVNVKATAIKDGKILFVQKYKFTGVSIQ